MVFINDVKMIYKGVVEANNYDCSGKTILQIVEDFKVHIMKDANSPLVYAVYTSSRFNFINPISNEMVGELKTVVDIEISPNVAISNNTMWLDFNSLL
jgi:hypothetical protein